MGGGPAVHEPFLIDLHVYVYNWNAMHCDAKQK